MARKPECIVQLRREQDFEMGRRHSPFLSMDPWHCTPCGVHTASRPGLAGDPTWSGPPQSRVGKAFRHNTVLSQCGGQSAGSLPGSWCPEGLLRSKWTRELGTEAGLLRPWEPQCRAGLGCPSAGESDMNLSEAWKPERLCGLRRGQDQDRLPRDRRSRTCQDKSWLSSTFVGV